MAWKTVPGSTESVKLFTDGVREKLMELQWTSQNAMLCKLPVS